MKTSLFAKIVLMTVLALALSWFLLRQESRHDHSSPTQTDSASGLPAQTPSPKPTVSEPEESSGRNNGSRVAAGATSAVDDAVMRQYGCTSTQSCQPNPGVGKDPRIADSAEEALWMRERGFPTREQQDLATQLGSAAVLQQASAERSTTLRILGLETLVRETQSEADVRSASQELDDLAGRGRQHYALYAAVEAHLRIARMVAQDNLRRGYHLDAAARMTKRAVLLGDYKAISLYWMFPTDIAKDLSFWARAEANAMAILSRGDVAPDQAGFGYRNISPRPNPADQERFLRDLALVRARP